MILFLLAMGQVGLALAIIFLARAIKLLREALSLHVFYHPSHMKSTTERETQ